MATVGIQLSEWSGTSGMKIRLRAPGSGTVVNTGGDTLTESTTTGYFTATVGETLTGLHNVDVVNSSDAVIWVGGLVNMSIDPAYVDDPTQLDGLLTVGAVAGAVTLPAIPNDWITAAGISNDAITAAKIADGAIDAATFASGAINAAAIASNAIDADALASDAVSEIQDGLATASALTTVENKIDVIDNLIDTEIASIAAQIGTAGDGLTNIPRTGYKLASDGLDSVATTAPSGVASNFREMLVQVWRRYFKKADQTSSQLKTYADDGTTVLTTQNLTDDGSTQTQGAAS